jgi:hypothetical protein
MKLYNEMSYTPLEQAWQRSEDEDKRVVFDLFSHILQLIKRDQSISIRQEPQYLYCTSRVSSMDENEQEHENELDEVTKVNSTSTAYIHVNITVFPRTSKPHPSNITLPMSKLSRISRSPIGRIIFTTISKIVENRLGKALRETVIRNDTQAQKADIVVVNYFYNTSVSSASISSSKKKSEFKSHTYPNGTQIHGFKRHTYPNGTHSVKWWAGPISGEFLLGNQSNLVNITTTTTPIPNREKREMNSFIMRMFGLGSNLFDQIDHDTDGDNAITVIRTAWDKTQAFLPKIGKRMGFLSLGYLGGDLLDIIIEAATGPTIKDKNDTPVNKTELNEHEDKNDTELNEHEDKNDTPVNETELNEHVNIHEISEKIDRLAYQLFIHMKLKPAKQGEGPTIHDFRNNKLYHYSGGLGNITTKLQHDSPYLKDMKFDQELMRYIPLSLYIKVRIYYILNNMMYIYNI